MQICFATRDISKINQLKAQLDEEHVELVYLENLSIDLDPPQNITHPADHAEYLSEYLYGSLKIPTVAEGTFLQEVKKPVAKSGQQSNLFANQSQTDKPAKPSAQLVSEFYFCDHAGVHLFRAELAGLMPEGADHSNPEKAFVPAGYKLPLSELTREERMKISPFNKAMRNLIFHLHKDHSS